MACLLIDNYDSYTFNLYQLIAECSRGEEVVALRRSSLFHHAIHVAVEPIVLTNDIANLQEVQRLVERGAVNSIVISPGPGSPSCPQDIGICLDVLRLFPHVPILGVCLGHQALAYAHGGKVIKAPEPVHGRLSTLVHSGHPIMREIPSGKGFDVVRYHSLMVDPASLPSCLEPIAWTTGQHHAVRLCPMEDDEGSDAGSDDRNNRMGGDGSEEGVIMALAHSSRPHFGVQFHPESICTAFGSTLIQNFLSLAKRAVSPQPQQAPAATVSGPWPNPEHQQGASLKLTWTKLPGLLSRCRPRGQVNTTSSESPLLDEELIFNSLFHWGPDTFWLDSSAKDRGRFSYMGGRGGRLWRRITYRLPAPTHSSPPTLPLGHIEQEDWQGNITSHSSHFLPTFLPQLVDEHRIQVTEDDARALPFNFWGGLVGYLGYELKSECQGGINAHASVRTPDAAWLLADRFLALDHHEGDIYAMSIYRDPSLERPQDADGEIEAKEWMSGIVSQLRHLRPSSLPQDKPASSGKPISPPFTLKHNRNDYMSNIEAYRQALHEGESYEVCATTRLERPHAPDPSTLYRALRRINPAPYAAWLSFEDCSSVSTISSSTLDGPKTRISICCSSPERFLRLDRGSLLEARPIKGTSKRSPCNPAEDLRLAEELRSSEKERAENLMIVDLLRNDLGRVCEVGSVHVPGLMEIESFSTVHQMVSTVRGVKRQGISGVECIRAAFPGGSMTGAPKIRTMEIIDHHEGCARGVYSGCLGFISFNDTFDLNIVIRTAVIAQTEESEGWISIGAGGAIVCQSDTGAEYDEMMLKARALLLAVGSCDGVDQAAKVIES